MWNSALSPKRVKCMCSEEKKKKQNYTQTCFEFFLFFFLKPMVLTPCAVFFTHSNGHRTFVLHIRAMWQTSQNWLNHRLNHFSKEKNSFSNHQMNLQWCNAVCVCMMHGDLVPFFSFFGLVNKWFGHIY